VDFTSHNETPGLGGRIDEAWFKEQFRNRKIVIGTGLSYDTEQENQLDAITGATSTSRSILNILNDVIDDTVTKLEVGS